MKLVSPQSVPLSPCDRLWSWNTVATETRICTVATCAIFATVLALAVLPKLIYSTTRRSQLLERFVPGSTNLDEQASRLTWLDNARFLLIFSIVFGHVVGVPTLFVPEKEYYMQPLLVLTSLFHIPMLSFISGVCSKKPLTQDRVARLLTCVVAPYIFSKMAWWLYFYIRSPITPVFNLFDSYQSGGLEWYLAALVCWRLTLALLSPLNSYALMVVAFSLGLVSGYWVGNDQLFALQRALAFFPFAAAGYVFNPHLAQQILLKMNFLQVIARCLLFGMLIYSVQHRSLLSNLDLGRLGDLNFDYYHQRAETRGWVWETRMPCGTDWYLSWTYRVVHYALHFLVGFTFLAAVPADKCCITEAGSQTMYPYLLHTWVTMSIAPCLEKHQALFRFIACPGFLPGGWVWALAGIGALPLTFFLSSQPVRMIFGPLVEPHWIGKLLFRQEVLQPDASSSLEDGNNIRFYRRSSHSK